ncbi:MAG: hypothetical protein ABI858_08835 [Pseudoxanthomonas sp.]
MKRLLVATLAAIGTLWLLGFLVSLAGLGSTATNLPVVNQIDPVNLLVTTLAMCVGGYLDGKRFIGVALAIMVMLWLAIVLTLLQVAQPVQPHALPQILAYSRMQILLSTLAACTGAAIGAWLRFKHVRLQAT